MPAAARAYHHGNLRAELLDAAERSIEKSGADQLSLRELAREAGVSHAAPRTHFPDRQALLQALVERGFTHLGATLRTARDQAAPDLEARLHAVIAAFVTFAATRPALVNLMFATKTTADEPHQKAAADTTAVVYDLINEGVQTGALAAGDPERYGLLLYAWAQGLATLTATGNLPPETANTLVAEAVSTFLRGNTPLP
ncbi:TetR/AcrR family transcriptional regulator [Actinoplanes couchii]|uniref:TetR family transcriptional regulator n=1 Tax=Actinoplanes couchii TaxID=403638 RepID=A0ABQ3X4R6_9ACTN|nr:TetR/AcrR family transcriptional regulator [Actinoplanes couchii]MDR6326135.1 AcrR family transcriptional regulator [Actinoplanes couchii]GID53512.1 TetR family transcriptional regulator [Actinoplanes couchii]